MHSSSFLFLSWVSSYSIQGAGNNIFIISCMAAFAGTPLYGPSLHYAGPASLVWGWVAVSFFTWFVGLALAVICSSFPVCFFFFLLLFYSLLITPRSWQWRSQKFGLGGKIKDKIESKNLIWKKLININNKVNNQLYANEILIHNLT